MTNSKESKPQIQSSRNIGKLSLEIEPDSLRKIVGEGRLIEFAHALGAHAAAQISAQIVEKLAEAAVTGTLANGISVGAAFVFEGGDFGTVPPKPRWGIFHADAISGGLLQQFAASERIG